MKKYQLQIANPDYDYLFNCNTVKAALKFMETIDLDLIYDSEAELFEWDTNKTWKFDHDSHTFIEDKTRPMEIVYHA